MKAEELKKNLYIVLFQPFLLLTFIWFLNLQKFANRDKILTLSTVSWWRHVMPTKKMFSLQFYCIWLYNFLFIHQSLYNLHNIKSTYTDTVHLNCHKFHRLRDKYVLFWTCFDFEYYFICLFVGILYILTFFYLYEIMLNIGFRNKMFCFNIDGKYYTP